MRRAGVKGGVFLFQLDRRPLHRNRWASDLHEMIILKTWEIGACEQALPCCEPSIRDNTIV
jgi:hypothetical protein